MTFFKKNNNELCYIGGSINMTLSMARDKGGSLRLHSVGKHNVELYYLVWMLLLHSLVRIRDVSDMTCFDVVIILYVP